MYYRATFYRHDDKLWVDFPGCPGCKSSRLSERYSKQDAKEVLETWLTERLTASLEIPKPHHDGFIIGGVDFIEVSLSIAFPIELRWKRKELGLSQAEVAERLGISQQSFARLERPSANPRLSTIDKLSSVGLCLKL